MKRAIGKITLTPGDFTASIELDTEWLSGLTPVERADLMQDVLADAMNAYNEAVSVLHATFEAQRAPKK